MPPKPTVPISRASHTCARRSEPSSEAIEAVVSAGWEGTQHHRATTVPTATIADQRVRPLPAEVLPDQGRERHADDVGDGQAGQHHRDRPRAPVPRHQGGGDDGADAEEGAVRQAGDEPRGHQDRVARGERGAEVAGGERDHQPQQHRPAPGPRGQDGDQRRPDDDPQRVRRDDVPGRRDGDRDAVRDLGQEAHRDELGGADGEPADREREDRQVDVPDGPRVSSVRGCGRGEEGVGHPTMVAEHTHAS